LVDVGYRIVTDLKSGFIKVGVVKIKLSNAVAARIIPMDFRLWTTKFSRLNELRSPFIGSCIGFHYFEKVVKSRNFTVYGKGLFFF